jgi:hypothetical protein
MTPTWKNPHSHGVLQAVECYPAGFIGLNGKESVNEYIALNWRIVKGKKILKNKRMKTIC